MTDSNFPLPGAKRPWPERLKLFRNRIHNWGMGWYYRFKFNYPARWRRFRDKVALAWKMGLLNFLIVWEDIREMYQQLQGTHGDGRVKMGRLEAFAETGTEGFCWMLYRDGKSGYDGLVNIEPGDRLIIFFHDGTVAFDGEIDPDWKAGYRRYPLNPKLGQPEAFGCWIHWTQRGFTPQDWAAFFFHGEFTTEEHPLLSPKLDVVPFRAIIVKTDKPVVSQDGSWDDGEDEDDSDALTDDGDSEDGDAKPDGDGNDKTKPDGDDWGS